MRLNLDEIHEVKHRRLTDMPQSAKPEVQTDKPRPLFTHRLLHTSGEALIALGLRLKKMSDVHSVQETMPVLWEDVT
jgi:hypothetical protein